MSIDPSLKTAGALAKHRNVLTRAERITRLQEKGAFDPESNDALGLIKVGNRRPTAGGKAKKKGAPDEDEKA